MSKVFKLPVTNEAEQPVESKVKEKNKKAAVKNPSICPSPGQALKQARLTKTLSQEEVANKLCLTLSYVNALENDEYQRLPGEIFVKGYLRNYAKLVDLPIEQILDGYEALKPAEKDSMAAASPLLKNMQPRPFEWPAFAQKTTSLYYLIGTLIIALIILVSIGINVRLRDTVPTVASMNVVEPIEQAIINTNEFKFLGQAFENWSNQLVSEFKVKPVEIPALTAAAPDTDKVATANSNEQPAEQPVTETALEPLLISEQSSLANGADTLVARFSHECWVEVRDKDQRLLLSAVKQPGESMSVQGQAPFYITLGYVEGVELWFNNKPVALEKSPYTDVARLTLNPE